MGDVSVPLEFEEYMRRIRSRDPLTFEAAYTELLPHVRAFVPELLLELERTPDAYTRAKVIELLGDAQAKEAIPALARELTHTDQNVRQWAVTSLLCVGDPGADALVDEYRRTHPEEFE